MMDLTTATPAEIDTKLADLHDAHSTATLQRDRAWENVERSVVRHLGLPLYTGANRTKPTADQTRDALREAAESEDFKAGLLREDFEDYQGKAEAVALISLDITELDDEYRRRGGWTRAFLVNNSNGHVHRSMNCSTTFISTLWSWLPQLSGHDEAEIVEKAGSDACTVCYPSAPVEVLSRPRSVFSKDEVTAQAERAERDAAKAERQRQKIAKGLTPDGSELVVVTATVRERFKTEQAATSWAVSKLTDVKTWRSRPLDEDETEAIATVVEAIAAKHGKDISEVQAEIEKKVVAKIKRDRR